MPARFCGLPWGWSHNDGDGKLSAVDALCALQMAVGKKTANLSLDINSDGKVTSLDARNILKLAVTGQ